MYATADGPDKVRAATFGREAGLGSLEEGRFADVTGFADDPVRDIHVVRDVRLVVKEGEVMRSDLRRGQKPRAIPSLRGSLPPASVPFSQSIQIAWPPPNGSGVMPRG